MHQCEASTAEVEGKLFTIGNRVDFNTKGQCLGQCGVRVGWFDHESCDDVLKGSIKVAKTRKRKLCCQVHQCSPSQDATVTTDGKLPAVTQEDKETPVTTTEPTPVTNDKEVSSTTEEEVAVTTEEEVPANVEEEVPVSTTEDVKPQEQTPVDEPDVDETPVETDAPADMVKAFGASLADRLYQVFDSLDELEGFSASEVEEYMGTSLSDKDRARLAAYGIN